MKTSTLILDAQRKDKHQITPQGFLVVDANLTRAGVFDYYDEGGKLVRELRSPEEVFKQESLDSLKFAIITKQHPSEMVDSSNAKHVQIGMVGENIVRNKDFVSSKIVINDKKEVDEILAKWDRGEDVELSMGYESNVIDSSGTHHIDGDYDKMQTDILYNHASVVDKGRAGSNVKLIMDALDEASQTKQTKQTKTEVNMYKFKKPEVVAGKFRMDAIMEEVTDEAKGVVDLLSTKVDEAAGVITSMSKDHDTLQAKHDESVESGKKLQVKLDELSDPTSTVVQDMIKGRVDLEAVAKTVDVKVAHEDGKSKDSKTLQVDIIAKVHPEFKADGETNDYVRARFDAVLDTLKALKEKEWKKSLGSFIIDAENNKSTEKKDPRQIFLDGTKDYHKKKEEA